MSELILSAFIALYNSLSLPIICSCPTTSSRLTGLILFASGESSSDAFSLIYSNKSISYHLLLPFSLLSFSAIILLFSLMSSIDTSKPRYLSIAGFQNLIQFILLYDIQLFQHIVELHDIYRFADIIIIIITCKIAVKTCLVKSTRHDNL